MIVNFASTVEPQTKLCFLVLKYSGRFMVLTKKRPHAAIQDGKIGTAPFTTVDALDAPGRSGRFLGTPSFYLKSRFS